jgi:hypothetical protein
MIKFVCNLKKITGSKKQLAEIAKRILNEVIFYISALLPEIFCCHFISNLLSY